MRAARERESDSVSRKQNMETLSLMQEMMAPPHHDEEPLKLPPPGAIAYYRDTEFHGLGNAPENTDTFQDDDVFEAADDVKPKSWGTGGVATPERGLNLPENPRSPPPRQLEQLFLQQGPQSPGGESSHSYSSEIEAEERQARARVNNVRRSFDSRPTPTMGENQHTLALTDGGHESNGYYDSYASAPAPIDIAQLQAANRSRALTPAGPVPRPSEAQRLQMHSRGGARRAAPGSLAGPAENFFNSPASDGGNDASWSSAFADPHVPPANRDAGRPWGNQASGGAGRGFRVEYEVERSPTQEQQQFAHRQAELNQQLQLQRQGASPLLMAQQVHPVSQSPVQTQMHSWQRNFNSPDRDRSFYVPMSQSESYGQGSQHTLDEIDEDDSSEHGGVRPKFGQSASLERQLERREREIHALRLQCTAMAKTLQREGLSVSGSPNDSGSVHDNISVHGTTPPQQQLNFSPPRSTQRGNSSPARGMVPSPPVGAMQMQPQNAWSSSPSGSNASGRPAPGSMSAMAAAAVGGEDVGAGWADARPIDRMEAAERVSDAIQSLRRSVRWCCVDLRRDGDGAAAESYGPGSNPMRKGRELRGRLRHLFLLLLFVISGVGRLLLLLLWQSERASVVSVAANPSAANINDAIGTDSRQWRAVLLLHAVALGSCAWQCMAGLGLFGVELREWEMALVNDIHTHGDIRLVEGWLRRGKRYANLGVLVYLCWGGLVSIAVWGGVVSGAERHEVIFLWAWPFDDVETAPTIATIHVALATALLAPLGLLPRLPVALAHAALLRGHRERLARSFLLDGQGFGGNSRALIVGKASEAAARYRAICTSVVVYGAAMDGGSGLSVALSLDMAAALIALYLLVVEPATVGTLWSATCMLLLARGAVQWPALLRIGASLSRYQELEHALLASSGTTAAAAAAAQGSFQRQAAVDEIALQQLVYTQRPAVGLCGGCVPLGWPLLGMCLVLLGAMLLAGIMV